MGTRDDGVLMKCGTVTDTACAKVIVSGRRTVSVTACQDEGDEPPGMIVISAKVIGGQPVMDTYGTDLTCVDAPSDDIGTFRQSERFAPADDKRCRGVGANRPNLRLIWALLLTL